MNYRQFQNENIAEIGLGTWQLGSSDWGNLDESQALDILNTYAAQGGNFIDTADVYGMGHSEKLIGKFLQQADKQIFVASKLGRRHDEPNGWPQNFTYEAMKRHTEETLQHLQQDQLFLQQLHCIPTEEMAKGDVFDHLRRLQQDGLIKHFGASVETADEALLCMQQEGIASLQLIFNLFRQHIADEVFAKAAEKNIALIIRVPLASGLLSGKFDQQTQFSENDHRNYNANGEKFNVGETFSGVDFKDGVKLAQWIHQLLPEDQPMAQSALRWILDHPQVTTVIPGASKPEQVNSNIAASNLPPLSGDAHRALRQLYDNDIKPLIRGRY